MRTTLLTALVAAATASGAAGQEPSPAPARSAARPTSIAVIDMQRVFADSLLGKGYASRIEALRTEIDGEGTKKQNELQKLDAGIKALQEELEKQAGVLSPEAADKKRQEIVRKNLPAGEINHLTLATLAVGGADESTFTTYNIPATALLAGDNVLAVEVHQNAGNSTDLSFDLGLTEPEWALGFRWDIVVGGKDATPLEEPHDD